MERNFSKEYKEKIQEITRKYKENDGSLNIMCINCLKRGKTCNGTTCQTWTGCVFRKIK